MWDWRYYQRLHQDLDKWRAAGVIDDQTEARIRATLPAVSPWAINPTLIFSGIGALILGLGIILIIAANWDEIQPVTKLSMVAGFLISSSLGSGFAFQRQMPALGQALALLTALAFGGAMALVAQIFHLPANAAGGFWLWALGALIVGFFFDSQWAMRVSGFALILSQYYFNDDFSSDDWGQPIFWQALPVLIFHLIWSMKSQNRSLHWLSFVGLMFFVYEPLNAFEPYTENLIAIFPILWLSTIWLIPAVWEHAKNWVEKQGWAAFAVCVAFFVLFVDADDFDQQSEIFLPTILLVGAVIYYYWKKSGNMALGLTLPVLYFGYLLPLRIGTIESLELAAYQIIHIGLSIAVIFVGSKLNNRNIINIGFGFLILVLSKLYFTFFWSQMDRGLAFVIGGILMLGLGWFLEKRRRKLMAGLS